MAQNKFLLHGASYHAAASGLKLGWDFTSVARGVQAVRDAEGAAPATLEDIITAVQALAATPYQIKAEGKVIEHKATERAANMAMNRMIKAGAKNAGWELLAKI